MKRVGNRILPAIVPAVRDHEVKGHRTGSNPGRMEKVIGNVKPGGRKTENRGRRTEDGAGIAEPGHRRRWKSTGRPPISALRPPFSVFCRPGQDGFTLIELLTVMAIVAVLATLLSAALGGARTRSHEVVCRNNLRQIAVATEIYQDDTGRRPRSYTRLTTRPTWVSNPRTLACPADPAVKAKTPPLGRNGGKLQYWGNRVNPTQEPMNGRIGTPDENTWEAEIRETTETVAFSYLHPLGWRREAWQRLVQAGNQSGVSACQLHGMRIPGEARRAYAQFEGQTLRAQRDGAVVNRKIFRTPGVVGVGSGSGTVATFTPTGENALAVPVGEEDYAWEFYTDGPPPPLR